MRAVSIVVVTAALLLAPVVPLASPAAAASQPVVSSVSPGSGTIGTPVTITGSGFDYGCAGGQSGQVYFGGIAAGNAISDGVATAVAPTHSAGAVYVTVADCSGDLSAASLADTFVYPAPVVSSVSPGSGTIGTPVTITGSGFDYGCTGGQSGQVYFGRIAAGNAISDGVATAVAPTHSAGAVYVTVADCLGDLSAASLADTFVYPAPVVSSVSPGSGTIGTPVTITGSGFDYGCTGGQSGQVYFGRIAAGNAISDGVATAVAPTHSAGAAYVTVADCLGDLSAASLADTFVYPAPVVSSVSPGSGTIGTPVTITGSGFDYGCTGGQSGQVYFGRIAAGNAISDGVATAVAPTHSARAAYVTVADCLGDLSAARRADLYTYLSPGPRFFGLHVHGTESRDATVIAQLLKPGVLALRVMRVASGGRLVFAGLVPFGQQPRGRSLVHWNFRINHRLLGPGRYELTLHGRPGGGLSAAAAPGARTLLILKKHRVRLLR